MKSSWVSGVMLTGVMLGLGAVAVTAPARAETDGDLIYADPAEAPVVAAPPAPAEGPTLVDELAARLESSRLLVGANLLVEVNGGRVTVMGEVPSPTARTHALDVVRGTPGVTSVVDQLRVAISSPGAPTRL
jgi:hypothetical protein